MKRTRPPAVAGSFYPGRRSTLDADVARLLADADAALPADVTPPKAVIAPHAGYVYSGSTAALAYARVARHHDRYTRVVLLGPCHRVAVRGLARVTSDFFDTPLGTVRLEPVPDLPGVVTSDEAHAQEHSLEVHLPFLQKALDAFTLVPLAVGHAPASTTGDVLDALWGDDRTLIVISSDLSHYLPHDQARARDDATITQILALDPTIDSVDACGAYPVNGMLVAAQRHDLTPTLLGACTSGDTAGERRRVVGYASVAFTEEAA